jgi:RNA polymerase sigma factor (sigma-70 family)
MDPESLQTRETPSLICERDEIRKALCAAVANLPERERIVLANLFWESKSLTDIAGQMNLTVQRIHQIKVAALQSLRILMKDISRN